MTPDQQRGIDEKIIEGKLIDAIGLYRAATGCGLPEAENAVRGRSAALNGQTPPPAVQTYATPAYSPPADAAIRTALRPVVPIVVFSLIVALIPIAIDQGGITCRTISNSYTSRTANCTLPVRGPNASGNVTIAVVDQPGSFGVAGQLATGGRTIDMASR